MASQPLASAFFSVRRHEPVVVTPAKPTPHDLKPLSDIDDQEGLRFHVPVIFFYRSSSDDDSTGRDPARVIKDALAKALVHYYPLAGRIREGTGRKLVVECTGEGIMFVEADADVSLEDLGDALPLAPPLVEEFFYQQADGSQGVITNCPLLFIQVTRLMCGGFVLSIRFTHVMMDAVGLMLFMNAVADIARGATGPAVPPVWTRELLSARTPPRVTHAHPEYDADDGTSNRSVPMDDVVHRWLLFGPREMAAMRKHVQPHLHNSSSAFELLAACLWRSRTIALATDPGEEVRLICVVEARSKCRPPLPAGYYGNVVASPVALSRAGDLCGNPLGYALELVRNLKSLVTDEYIRSVADLMVLRGRPPPKTAGGYLVSDITRANLEDVDFGWGDAVSGGVGGIPGSLSFFFRAKNSRWGDGTMVSVCLPRAAMERFTVEIERMTTEPLQELQDANDSGMLRRPSRL